MQIKAMQIKSVSHESHTLAGADPDTHNNPAGFALALAVAHELHAPAPRAPEVASASVPRGAARRSAAARTTRRTARS